MDVAQVIGLASQLHPVSVHESSHEGVRSLLKAAASVRRWLDGVEVAAAKRLNELAEVDATVFPQATIGSATRTSPRQADRTVERARTIDALPEVGDALADAGISAAHVDVLTSALKRLEPADRDRFAERDQALADAARRTTPDEFADHVRRELRRAQSDDGLALLARQKRAVFLRTWTDRDSGMTEGRFSLDPESALSFLGALDARVESLFHDHTPDTCPTDPSAKQDHLRGLALVHLATSGSGSGRAEITVVIDHQTLESGLHDNSILDTGQPVDLPVETLRRLACGADIIPAVLGTNGVLLDLGRSTRLANANQRRAIRAMYATCAFPGCQVGVRHCAPHHVHYWTRGGFTDLSNLLPLCSRHHHAVHEGGFSLRLAPDRTLIVTRPDGTRLTTGPPRARAA